MHARVFGFTGLFDALAVAVEVPAMERAAQTVVFQPPIAQISATVRTVTPDQAHLAVFIAKQNQLFAQQGHRHHRAGAVQLICQGSRLPVAAQHFSGGLACVHQGNLIVEFLADHVICSF